MQLTHFPCLAPSLSSRPLAHSHNRSRLLTRPNRSPTHPCVANSWSLARLPGCSCFAHQYLLTRSCRTRSHLLIHSPACSLSSLRHRLLVLYSPILPRALLAHTPSGFTRPYSLVLYSPILAWALLAHTHWGFTRPYSLGLYSLDCLVDSLGLYSPDCFVDSLGLYSPDCHVDSLGLYSPDCLVDSLGLYSPDCLVDSLGLYSLILAHRLTRAFATDRTHSRTHCVVREFCRSPVQ